MWGPGEAFVVVIVIVMGGNQSQLLALALDLGWSLTTKQDILPNFSHSSSSAGGYKLRFIFN